MNTSDPHIAFDDRGWCDYCNEFEATIRAHWHTDQFGEAILRGKHLGRIIGLSSGLDGSCVAQAGGGEKLILAKIKKAVAKWLAKVK